MLRVSMLSDSGITPQVFGGKAAGLKLLCDHGYAVPETIVIESSRDAAVYDDPCFQKDLMAAIDGWGCGVFDVAVRSSCTSEDSFGESMAGHFDTFIGDMTFETIVDNAKRLVCGLKRFGGDDAKMGVIVQKKVDAEYSGVIYSSHPVTYSKKSMVINFVPGMGQGLVSGNVIGSECIVSAADGDFVIDVESVIKEALLELSQRVKWLEQVLGYPVDIEWALCDGVIYYLQCRPLASITKVMSDLFFVSKDNTRSRPPGLVSHGKIGLRLFAQENGAMISDAYVHIQNLISGEMQRVDIPRSGYCKGHSAVLIYPQLSGNKVLRSFVGDRSLMPETIEGCSRFEVLSFPKYESLDQCLSDYFSAASGDFWVCATIIQEIFDPLYTGAIQRTSDGFLVEITKGHFMSKGTVPSSRYLTDGNGVVVSKKEITQHEWFKIIEGHELRCQDGEKENGVVSLPDSEITSIVGRFMSLLKTVTTIAEFGVLQIGANMFMPYLIDYTDDFSGAGISASDVLEGIVSRGSIKGKAVHIKDLGSESHDFHYYDLQDQDVISSDGSNIVFFCDKPYISLLPLIYSHDPQKIGFVFSECSIASHLPAVLREKGIPAIETGGVLYAEDGFCTVDAEATGLSRKDRLIWHTGR